MRNTTYFQNIHSLEELRKQYKTLLKQFHPDNGGDSETIKIINVEYEALFEDLKRFQSTEDKSTKAYDTTADKGLRSVLNSIINLDVNIEICGTWIWVTGNTYPCKDTLKKSGFRWSKNKKAWYWHSEDYVKYGKKTYSMTDIRLMHGSEEIKTYRQVCIGA